MVALWKDPARGVQRDPLERGAHGVLLTVCMDRATRRSADGRWPVDNGTVCFDVATHQVRAGDDGTGWLDARSPSPSRSSLEAVDLTVLTGWAEAVAEVLAHQPDRIDAPFHEARAGAPWRAELGLREPSTHLSHALETIRNLVSSATPNEAPPTFDAVLSAAETERQSEGGLESVARRVLLAVLEQRLTRQPAAGAKPSSRGQAGSR